MNRELSIEGGGPAFALGFLLRYASARRDSAASRGLAAASELRSDVIAKTVAAVERGASLAGNAQGHFTPVHDAP